MDEIVERVARAIYFRGDDQGDDAWNHCQSWHRDVAREQAHAAIAAMREPKQEPVAWRRYEAFDNETAGYELYHRQIDGGEPLYAAPCAIDAALAEKEG